MWSSLGNRAKMLASGLWLCWTSREVSVSVAPEQKKNTFQPKRKVLPTCFVFFPLQISGINAVYILSRLIIIIMILAMWLFQFMVPKMWINCLILSCFLCFQNIGFNLMHDLLFWSKVQMFSFALLRKCSSFQHSLPPPCFFSFR